MSNIEEQAAEAERLHREQYPELYTDNPELDADGKPVVKEELDADGNPVVKDEPVSEDKPIAKVELNEDGSPKVVTPVAPVDTEDYKQKYFVLKGKYDAEVPRLSDELKELRTSVKELQTVKVEPQKEVPDDLLSDPIFKVLSDEFPDVYKALSVINKRLEDKIPKVDPGMESRIAKVEETTVKTAEERFVADLNSNASDWADINQDPRFVNWLNEEDPLTGYKRLDLATAAQNNLNGRRVAAFYNSFKKTFGIETKDSTDNTNTGTGEKVDTGKKDMSKFTAPNSSKSGTVDTKQNVDTITREFVDKFYTDSSKGSYVGREEEAAKIEARITKALQENKIV